MTLFKRIKVQWHRLVEWDKSTSNKASKYLGSVNNYLQLMVYFVLGLAVWSIIIWLVMMLLIG